MASSGGASSCSSLTQTSGSEEAMVDQRKRKRMISNRESEKRPRRRKHKHLDDLTAQVSVLRTENHRISTSINVITLTFLTMDGENLILEAQVGELSHRLSSLNEIISFSDAIDGCSNPPSY